MPGGAQATGLVGAPLRGLTAQGMLLFEDADALTVLLPMAVMSTGLRAWRCGSLDR